jgi:RHS repeat-associated protein
MVQYSYDNDDRLTGEMWKNAALVTVNTLSFTWDNDDNLLTAANGTGTETYTYNDLDEVASYTNVWGQTLDYSYDDNGNVTQRTDSLGGTLSYYYDADNELTSEQFSGTGATGTDIRVDFGYDAARDQTSITWYSNLSGTSEVAESAYSYDTGGRLTGITNTNASSTTLSYYDYSYDNDNRMSTQTHWSEVGTTVYSGTNTYTYDAISQLTSDGSSYSYDATGNRTMSGYSTGADNEMTSDGTYSYCYDAEGNLTEKTKGSGLETWYFTYDNANELTYVNETSNGTTSIMTATYQYDAEGDLVGEQLWQTGIGTTTTRYAVDPVDGENDWAVLDSSNNILVRYEWGAGADQILTRTVASGGNAGAWAYLTDAQGSVRDLVNWSGVVSDHLDYNAYGVATESNPSVGSPIEYDGYQYEAATGLDYTEARWYNPSTGTWQTQDPAGFAAGQANLNQYVGNDPTNLTDPTGLGSILGGSGWGVEHGGGDGLHHAHMTLHGEWGASGSGGLGGWGGSGDAGGQTGGNGVWGSGGLDLGSLLGGQPTTLGNRFGQNYGGVTLCGGLLPPVFPVGPLIPGACKAVLTFGAVGLAILRVTPTPPPAPTPKSGRGIDPKKPVVDGTLPTMQNGDVVYSQGFVFNLEGQSIGTLIAPSGAPADDNTYNCHAYSFGNRKDIWLQDIPGAPFNKFSEWVKENYDEITDKQGKVDPKNPPKKGDIVVFTRDGNEFFHSAVLSGDPVVGADGRLAKDTKLNSKNGSESLQAAFLRRIESEAARKLGGVTRRSHHQLTTHCMVLVQNETSRIHE